MQPSQLSKPYSLYSRQAYFTIQKTQAISYTVNEELKTLCPECQLTGQEIFNATLECVSESPNSVIFSAVISGTAEKDSRGLLEELSAWISSTSPSISVLGVVLGLGEECSSVVSDLGGDFEFCSKLRSSTCETPTNDTQANQGGSCNDRETKSSGTLGLSVGVGIGVGLVLILVAGAVVLIPFCFLKYRRSSMQSYLVKKE